MCIDMAKDIAGNFDGKVEYIESTYGNSVLDLQAGKIDLAFAFNPTPKRALVIDFTHPFYLHGFGMVGKKGFKAANWADLDKPEVKVAFDIGSAHESRRSASPNATIIGSRRATNASLAVQSGRADCVIMAVNLGLTAVKKNPALGRVPDAAAAAHATCRPAWACARSRQGLANFLNAWVDYNRGIQQIREWLSGRAGDQRGQARGHPGRCRV